VEEVEDDEELDKIEDVIISDNNESDESGNGDDEVLCFYQSLNWSHKITCVIGRGQPEE